MLFTPRLFEFKTSSMDFSGGDATKVAGMYADLAYCAALNFWTLTEHDVEEYQLTRLDFHEWSAQNPSEFGKVIRTAIEAITNKNIEDLVKDGKSPSQEVKKKTSLSIIQKLRHSWLAIVGCRKNKQLGHR